MERIYVGLLWLFAIGVNTIIIMYNLTKKYRWDWEIMNDTVWYRLTDAIIPVCFIIMITVTVTTVIMEKTKSNGNI